MKIILLSQIRTFVRLHISLCSMKSTATPFSVPLHMYINLSFKSDLSSRALRAKAQHRYVMDKQKLFLVRIHSPTSRNAANEDTFMLSKAKNNVTLHNA